METAESIYWTGLGNFVSDIACDGHTSSRETNLAPPK